MRALVELGADPLLPNADNSTPLMAAAGLGTRSPGEDAGTEPEVLAAVRLALELGADIDAVDDNGETAMHGAAYKNLPKVVALLAAKGADIEIWNKRNAWGWTPLEIAEGYRFGNFKPSPVTVAALHEPCGRGASIRTPTGAPSRASRFIERSPRSSGECLALHPPLFARRYAACASAVNRSTRCSAGGRSQGLIQLLARLRDIPAGLIGQPIIGHSPAAGYELQREPHGDGPMSVHDARQRDAADAQLRRRRFYGHAGVVVAGVKHAALDESSRMQRVLP